MAERTLGQLIEGQEIWFASPADSVLDAVRKMVQRNIGALPILESGKVAAIFTERDLLRRVIASGKDPATTPLSQVMSKPVVTSAPGESVLDALRKMRDRNCRHLVVVESDKILGVVSMRSILLDVLEVKEKELQEMTDYLEYLPPEAGVG